MDPHFFWYVTRAAGMVAFGLLALSAVLGLLLSTRTGKALLGRPWVLELHKTASLLSLAFIGLHMAALLPDQWTDFGWVDLLVPGASTYQPAPVAVGILAMYGAVLAAASFYARRLIGRALWTAAHSTALAAFFLAMFHGLIVGTDSPTSWMQLTYAGSGLLVSALTIIRLLEADATKERASRGIRERASALN